MMRLISHGLWLSLALLFSGYAHSQGYPTRPIKVLIGFPAGSSVGIMTREFAPYMEKQLGQPLVVESRPGAGGAIAARSVAKAEPDGYTIFSGIPATLIAALVKSDPVNAVTDLAPIADTYSSAFVFYVSAKLPVRTFAELVRHAKSLPPGTLNFASTLGQAEMMAALVGKTSGITYTVIRYPGSPQTIPALISGEAGLLIGNLATFQPYIDKGIRALFTSKRISQLPDLPTAAEVGIPNVEAATFDTGFWAPIRTPRDIIDKLNRAAVSAVKTPEVTAAIRKFGLEPVGSSPEAQLKNYEDSVRFWSEAARITNFQPE